MVSTIGDMRLFVKQKMVLTYKAYEAFSEKVMDWFVVRYYDGAEAVQIINMNAQCKGFTFTSKPALSYLSSALNNISVRKLGLCMFADGMIRIFAAHVCI